MKALFLTNEYPPHIYGGAGIHVQYLTRELSRMCDVEVRCFGDQNDRINEHLTATGHGLDAGAWTCPKPLAGAFGAVQRSLDFNTSNIDADLVHLHTWYTHFGGILARLNYGIPMVLTTHSLEPLRPWKREQLAGGYDFSLWVEKTAIEMADAVIAVSHETKIDILRFFHADPKKIHVIHNGIDPEEYRKTDDPDALRKNGVNPDRPMVLFVGRITRQKGIIHLVHAIRHMEPGFQVVLCAGTPDTPEIAAEMKQAVADAQSKREGIVWIQATLPVQEKIALYSHADVFCCPSIYEPFGIINLEAMACETAVVASAVGGIKEVVLPGETGILVPLLQQAESPYEAQHPEQYARDLAEAVNKLMADRPLRERMARAGRERAVNQFSWSAIAQKTFELYRTLVK